MESMVYQNRKIPCGISDYNELKRENYIYVDKTKYIETLEKMNSKYQVFLRPRRFGKTLFVSTLQNYYDINNKDKFDTLFGDTYIGEHKTELANSYYVLRFDFQALSTENEEQLISTFRAEVVAAIEAFESKYNQSIEFDKVEKYPARLLGSFLTNVFPITQKKVYVMVDEYDHFANDLLQDKEAFRNITGKNGFVRSFYEMFKYHTAQGCIDRIFITGVTSLTLDSLTSGFNIAKNISMRSSLNAMVGFTKDETKGLLHETGIDSNLFSLLEDNYNGYLFHKEADDGRVFNSNMVLYFLDEYYEQRKVPDKLVDSSIRTDYQKLTSMFDLFEDEEERKHILESIMSEEGIETDIVTNFDFSMPFTEADFLSMLYYLGLLTIKEKGKGYDVVLQTPNAAIRDIYYQYYANYLNINSRQKRGAVVDIAYKNNFTEFNNVVKSVLKMHSNQDYTEFNEARLKSVFLSCFSGQHLYLVKSEYEAGGKRIDIALFSQYGEKEIKYNYLIELKYIQKSKAKETNFESVRAGAVKQMQEYLQLDEFKNYPRLKGFVYVVVKDEIVVFEEVKV